MWPNPQFPEEILSKKFCAMGCIYIWPNNQFKNGGNQMEVQGKVQEMCRNDGCLSDANDINAHLRWKFLVDARLRDLLIQNSVIDEGTVDKTPCGRTYKRGVGMHKLVWYFFTKLGSLL